MFSMLLLISRLWKHIWHQRKLNNDTGTK